MNIEKYYWEAKDENECRVIFGLLSASKMPVGLRTMDNIVSYGPFHFILDGMVDSGSITYRGLSDRTLSTTADLVELVKQG